MKYCFLLCLFCCFRFCYCLVCLVLVFWLCYGKGLLCFLGPRFLIAATPMRANADNDVVTAAYLNYAKRSARV